MSPRPFGGSQLSHVRTHGSPMSVSTEYTDLDESGRWPTESEVTLDAGTVGIVGTPDEATNLRGEGESRVSVERSIVLPESVTQDVPLSDGNVVMDNTGATPPPGKAEPSVIVEDETGVGYSVIHFETQNGVIVAEVSRR